MRFAALVVIAGVFASVAGAAPAERWAGLERAQVVELARAGAAEYTKAGAGAVSTIVMRRYWQGHEAWVVKADFTCAGGHYPAIVLWRGVKPFRPGGSSFMCRAAKGKPIACLELAVC